LKQPWARISQRLRRIFKLNPVRNLTPLIPGTADVSPALLDCSLWRSEHSRRDACGPRDEHPQATGEYSTVQGLTSSRRARPRLPWPLD
jgi:hypothetical protein